ncbi:hypothetical protein ACVWYG_003740 [Pedobacter sp. UYEF25]
MRYGYIVLIACLANTSMAQKSIKDQSVIYQQERMVFKQWDRNKFTPTSGWLGINPYYLATWAWHISYKNSDKRPLGPAGPQTLRLGMVGNMSEVEKSYKQHSDTLRNTAILEIANQEGSISGGDPLWLLYYSKELKPVLENSPNTILSGLSNKVKSNVLESGIYEWYKKELDKLRERVEGARTTNMDRGSRILAYHRMLIEYRNLYGSWSARISSAGRSINLTEQQQRIKAHQIEFNSWTPQSDIAIANDVVRNRKY